MPNTKAGRPRASTYHATRAKVKRLKSSINPATGKLWTYREIGKKLGGISGPAAAYYLKGDKGCPCCTHELKVRA